MESQVFAKNQRKNTNNSILTRWHALYTCCRSEIAYRPGQRGIQRNDTRLTSRPWTYMDIVKSLPHRGGLAWRWMSAKAFAWSRSPVTRTSLTIPTAQDGAERFRRRSRQRCRESLARSVRHDCRESRRHRDCVTGQAHAGLGRIPDKHQCLILRLRTDFPRKAVGHYDLHLRL